VGASWNCKKITRKINALPKKRSFQKMLFENPVPLYMRLRMQPRSVRLAKWPVFSQNTFGNPKLRGCSAHFSESSFDHSSIWWLNRSRFTWIGNAQTKSLKRHVRRPGCVNMHQHRKEMLSDRNTHFKWIFLKWFDLIFYF